MNIDINNQTAEETKTKKRRNYKKELFVLEKEHKELKNQLLRIAAEFDNFKKRTVREKSDLVETANSMFIKELLPVFDDLERSLASSDSDKNTLVEGLSLLRNNFFKIMQDHGLEIMESVGQEFDPERHDALLQVEAEGKDSNIVVEEHIKGYIFKDRVLRHAKVIVSK